MNKIESKSWQYNSLIKGVATRTTITKRPHGRETAPKSHQKQDTLSCTATITRPTLNVSLICSHQEVIIAKEKKDKHRHENERVS